MVVLSLFDGIACGRLALERAGIRVDRYFASEIDKAAIAIAKKNYPDIIEMGNILDLKSHNSSLYNNTESFYIPKIDLLIGGSPCTNFSSIGYGNGMCSEKEEITSLDQYLGQKEKSVQFVGQSYLFWEYVRLLKETNPKYFLLENVKMAKKWESLISETLGVEPVFINSSLVSAQNRPRLYWTNIPTVAAPHNKQISIQQILDDDADISDVSYCKTVQRSLPKLVTKYGYVPEMFNAYNANQITKKAPALSRGSMITSSCAALLFVRTERGIHRVSGGMLDGLYPTRMEDGAYNLRKLNLKEMERLQTLPDDYTLAEGVSNQKRSNAIGNGWTVDVIAHIFQNIIDRS